MLPQLLWNFDKAIGLEISYAHCERLADVVLHLRPNTQAMPEIGGSKQLVCPKGCVIPGHCERVFRDIVNGSGSGSACPETL